MNVKQQIIEIYTDGSARGNPGPAGWGSVIIDHKTASVVELGGRADLATNNRMELLALHDTLGYIEDKKLFHLPAVIYIDSTYVQKGVTLWMYAWERNGWKTASGSDVLNQDLWQEIFFRMFRLKRQAQITFEKIAGHAGHFGNEQADRIATSFADKKATILFKGSLSDYQILAETQGLENKTTRKIAVRHVAHEESTPIKKTKSSNQKAFSYVSYVAGVVHVDTDWKSCEARVKGKTHARYKKVFSLEEQEQLIHEFARSK